MSRIALLLLLGVVSPSWSKSVCPPEGAAGQWSREATFLCPQYKQLPWEDFTRDMRIQSPDGKATARIGYEHWWLETVGRKVGLKPHELRITEDDSIVTENAELAWAPDSKTFYLTQSENRAGVQGFYTLVFRVDGSYVANVLNVNALVQREFDRHHGCVFWEGQKRYSEEADIGAVKWMNGSDELLMVAETPYDSLCTDSRGYFAGYLVSLAHRKVIRSYSAQELMSRRGDVVGDRLKEGFRSLTAKQRDAEP